MTIRFGQDFEVKLDDSGEQCNAMHTYRYTAWILLIRVA